MKVLLLGDYSSVHYNLYRGLIDFGIDVTLVSSGDGSKQIPTNIKWTVNRAGRFSKLLGINGRSFLSDNSKLIGELSGYDVVQIINPMIVEEGSVKSNRELFKKIKEENGKVFLYSCGDDLNWVSSCLAERSKRSMFSEASLYSSTEIVHPIRYVLNPGMRRLSNLVYTGVDGIIPGSTDYNWCVKQRDKLRTVIPFPVDLDMFSFKPVTYNTSYSILHGYQPGKAIRKGDQYFEKAVESLSDSNSFRYRKIGGVPFLEYISLIHECDIFFDQVHSRDQGMNAIFAMACGKITFSGFEKEFYDFYGLRSIVGINATPSSMGIADMLTSIKHKIVDIEKITFDARRFVENFHDKNIVTSLFMREWLK